MAIAITIVAAVLLTAVAITVARAGGRNHQEDLSGHGSEVARPRADRPADAGAEAMGVSEPGVPSSDPDGERHR